MTEAVLLGVSAVYTVAVYYAGYLAGQNSFRVADVEKDLEAALGREELARERNEAAADERAALDALDPDDLDGLLPGAGEA